MGSMKGVALVATLAVLVSTATVSAEVSESHPVDLDVKCDKEGQLEEISVTEPKTTLTVTCPEEYTIQPPAAATQGKGQQQKVFSNVSCESQVDLSTVCSGASATAASPSKNGLVFQFPERPCEGKEFYLLCEPTKTKNADGKQCKARVLIKNATQPDGGADGLVPGDGHGSQGGPTGQGGTGGTAGVQICAHAKRSITIRIPEKGASVQFACESTYNLYPIEPDKVFSKDCKKQETLQDMTRMQAPTATAAPGSPTGPLTTSPTEVPTYTLKADKKPAKKTLCYLCAKEGATPDKPGPVEINCTIYVETGAGTQSGLGYMLALMLPCVLAVLRFM